ncbi:MAG: AAA domain-containing protein [Euryarchaeota archaeon]
MEERGNVRRMNSSAAQKKADRDIAGEMPLKWPRGQEHFTRFAALIRRELDDETEMVEERWKSWSKQRLLAAGLALFDLNGRGQGRFFGEPIVVFENRQGSRLPSHRFGHGDIVLISRARPWGEKVIEGIVLDRGPTRIRIVVSEKPKDLKKGTWRLDRGANRVAHDRMHEALSTFHSSEGEGGTVLRDLLLGSLHDMATSAARPPEIHGQKRRGPLGIDKMTLNDSQRQAVESAIERRLTLIQGPPGTGKTHTAVHLLSTFVTLGRGPVLATAESNVAVDNLLEGLLELGVKAVRIGRPVKVREHLRQATLDAQIERHPLQEELAFVREQNAELRKNLGGLRGKEKGMAHREVNQNFKEMRNIESNMISSVLDGAEVICATTIGVGHNLLRDRRFPVVLMDEATQASEPSALVPITRGCRQLVLVGDHKQLPPTVISKAAQAGGLGQSLFERLTECGVDTHMLTTQYRMHPTIREYPSARFYDDRLDDGCTPAERPPAAGFLWPDWDHPVAFVPVEGSEIVDDEGSSKSNLDEAAKVLSIVSGLLSAGDLTPADIGVITPYRGQVSLLNDLFEQAGGREEHGPFAGLEIKSVDGYQGREKEIIVFSAVRANDQGEVGFLRDQRRLNVAITRARRGLIVLGHPKTLRQDGTWRAWLDWAEERGLFAWHVTHG